MTRSTSSSRRAVAALLSFLFTFTMADMSHQHLHSQMQKRTDVLTAEGCYSSDGGGMVSQGSYIWQSSAHCGNTCQGQQKPVMALTNGDECACGDLLPAASSKLSDGECSSPCAGYNKEPCGGLSSYTIWLTGVDDSVGTVSGGTDSDTDSSSTSVVAASSSPAPSIPLVLSTSSAEAPTTAGATSIPASHISSHAKVATPEPTTIVEGQRTIVKTIKPEVQTVEASQAASSWAGTSAGGTGNGSGSSDTIGIAVGVVVGVLGFVALVVFAVFYLRRRRRMKNAENGHARADSLNAFVAGGGALPGRPLANDTRLDPRIMVERRRQSSGSVFADNEDYSRRILKVTNPEDN